MPTLFLLTISILLVLTPVSPVWANDTESAPSTNNMTQGQAGPELFRWVDAQGHVHYGEEVPAGVEAKRIKLPASPAAPKAAAKPSSVSGKKTPASKPKQKTSRKKSANKAPSQAALERQRQSHRSKCIEAEAKLRRIETQLRQGVKAKQSERLRERQRSWSIVKKEYCITK